MKLSVKLFAAARQTVGADAVEVDLPEPATVEALRGALAEQYPALGGLLKHALFAVNTEYAYTQMEIPPGSEVACIPPVSGG